MRKLKGPKPLRTFYLYPDGGWIHFRVFVWKTKHDMYLAIPNQRTYNFEAISVGGDRYVQVGKRWQFCGEIGQLHFYEDTVRTGIITHECCHAAYAYFRFRRWFQPVVYKDRTMPGSRRESVTQREECFCWIMGNLVREFIFRYHRMRGEPKAAPGWFKPVRFRRYSHPMNWDGYARAKQSRRQ